MAPKAVTLLKFVGSISLGLLTGVSYTLSNITIPTLLTLPSASSASVSFTQLTSRALTNERIWAGLSTCSFLLAYALSPRSARHPYLLWTSLLVAGSGLTDLVLPPQKTKSIVGARQTRKTEKKGKMEASYEVLGDSHSEGTSASDEAEEDINGEELRSALEGYRFSQFVRLALSGTGLRWVWWESGAMAPEKLSEEV